MYMFNPIPTMNQSSLADLGLQCAGIELSGATGVAGLLIPETLNF